MSILRSRARTRASSSRYAGAHSQTAVAATTERLTVGEKIDDASITSQVKFALLSHKSTSALKTKVTTTDGVIVLRAIAGICHLFAISRKEAVAARANSGKL